MGTLRFLLACSVITSHVQPFIWVNPPFGAIAVQGFFIISGFYMALILCEKYTGYWLFISNRILRLWPVYLLILAMTFVLKIVDLTFFDATHVTIPHFDSLNPTSQTFVLFTNIFIIGQDISAFFGPNAQGTITFETGDFKNFTYTNLVVQCWSTAMEFNFYLLAPFLVNKKTRTLLFLLSGSVLIRIVIYKLNLRDQPWGYRFLPSELVLFIMGILSYRIYKYIENKKILDNPSFIYPTAISLIFLFTLTIFYPFQSNLPSARSIYLQNVYQVIPGPLSAKWIYLTSITLIGPILFLLYRNSKYDRFLGDLSYPVFFMSLLFLSHNYTCGWRFKVLGK